MCTHHHKKIYINGLSQTCTLPNYFGQLRKEQLQFPDLPIDDFGKCIFHSTDLKWKRANHCGERFWELFQTMAKDESLENIDYRAFILTGLAYREAHGYQEGEVPLQGDAIIPMGRLHLKTPLRMQGAKFYDDVLIQDCIFEESVDFDEAVFKNVLTIERCEFKSMVSFINDCRLEHNLWVEDCLFAESTDFHNMVALHQIYFTDVTFGAEALFVGISQITPDLLCSFSQVTFLAYTSFSSAGFNSSLTFDECRFFGETHFENTAFRKRLQILNPLIKDKVFIQGTKPGVKLFENAVDFEVAMENFQEAGQVIFKNVNLFNLNAEFKSQLKSLELNHKIDIREGCILYRTAIERRFSATKFNKVILEDICHALSGYFESLHNRALKVDISRDVKENEIIVVFHTDENMSIPQLEAALYQAKKKSMEFIYEPKEQFLKTPHKQLYTDHYFRLKSIWERYNLAFENGLLDVPILEELMTINAKEVHKELKQLFHLNIHIHGKNIILNSHIQAGKDVWIGDD